MENICELMRNFGRRQNFPISHGSDFIGIQNFGDFLALPIFPMHTKAIASLHVRPGEQ